MNNKKTLLILIGSLFIVSCSSQDLYEAAQQNRKTNCQTKAPEEQAQCNQDLNKKTYEEYEKSRQEVIKGNR